MLDLAMQHIKLPLAARDFILNLFSCRKNRVITFYGLTDPYDVLIGIDQGEVISLTLDYLLRSAVVRNSAKTQHWL